jgi:hypothetical protein
MKLKQDSFGLNSNTLAVRHPDGHLRWLDNKRKEFLSSIISKRQKKFNDLVSRNAGRGLVNQLLKVYMAIHPRISSSVVIQIVMFCKSIHKIWRARKMKGLVLYLKACQVMLQQAIGGYKVKDLSELKCRPKRNRSGFPIIIHRHSRNSLIKHDSRSVKLWMTLFGIYRVLEFPGSLKLETITSYAPNFKGLLKEWDYFITKVWSSVLIKENDIEFERVTYDPIQTSAPNVYDDKVLFDEKAPALISTHIRSLIYSAKVWMSNRDYIEKFKNFSYLLSSQIIMSMRFVGSVDRIQYGKKVLNLNDKETNYNDYFRLQTHTVKEKGIKFFLDSKFGEEGYYRHSLGALRLKFEPAGKIRVFAMVDAWTQWIMKPLHLVLFNILKRWRTDGTFNQIAPINRLISEFGNPTAFVKNTTFYSLDLSAATDRLPIRLQQTIVGLIYEIFFLKNFMKSKPGSIFRNIELSQQSIDFALTWKELLVGRVYTLSFGSKPLTELERKLKAKKDGMFTQIKGLKHRLNILKYEVGQPMGALSSWAMLAMTHHAIVAFAAWRAGLRNFNRYAILGDDIIIANSKVALEYLKILDTLGVKVGLAKSIVSKRRFVLEFAKKFFVDSKQMNMIPIKDCITTWISTSLVKEFTEKHCMSINSALAFLNYGYKSRMKALSTNLFKLNTRVRVLIVWLMTPNTVNGRKSWLGWILLKSVYSLHLDAPGTVIAEVIRRCEVLVEKELELFSKGLDNYKKSLTKISNIADEQSPIVSFSARGVGHSENTVFDRRQVPWLHVFNDVVDIDSPGGWSSYDEVHKPFIKDKTYYHYYDINSILEYCGLEGNSLKRKLKREQFTIYDDEVINYVNDLMSFIWGKNSLLGSIPSEYWPLDRKVENVFDDFNRLYKHWVYLSFPIWQHYNKTLQANLRNQSLPSVTKSGSIESGSVIREKSLKINSPLISNETILRKLKEPYSWYGRFWYYIILSHFWIIGYLNSLVIPRSPSRSILGSDVITSYPIEGEGTYMTFEEFIESIRLPKEVLETNSSWFNIVLVGSVSIVLIGFSIYLYMNNDYYNWNSVKNFIVKDDSVSVSTQTSEGYTDAFTQCGNMVTDSFSQTSEILSTDISTMTHELLYRDVGTSTNFLSIERSILINRIEQHYMSLHDLVFRDHITTWIDLDRQLLDICSRMDPLIGNSYVTAANISEIDMSIEQLITRIELLSILINTYR